MCKSGQEDLAPERGRVRLGPREALGRVALPHLLASAVPFPLPGMLFPPHPSGPLPLPSRRDVRRSSAGPPAPRPAASASPHSSCGFLRP